MTTTATAATTGARPQRALTQAHRRHGCNDCRPQHCFRMLESKIETAFYTLRVCVVRTTFTLKRLPGGFVSFVYCLNGLLLLYFLLGSPLWFPLAPSSRSPWAPTGAVRLRIAIFIAGFLWALVCCGFTPQYARSQVISRTVSVCPLGIRGARAVGFYRLQSIASC